MNSKLKYNVFLDNLAKNFEGIRENVKLPYYAFSHPGMKRKKNINDADFFQNLHDAFYEFWRENKLEGVINDSLLRQEELNPQIIRNALTFLFQNLSFADFKILVNVFEKMVNNECIYGDTAFYRSLLLDGVDCDYISQNKQKIEYVCKSFILTRNDNVCDRFTFALFERSFDKSISMIDFYKNYLKKSWLVMAKFHENSDIINNFYPDDKWQMLCGDTVKMVFPEKVKLNIEKIDSDIFIKKFGILLLADIQEDIKPVRLKKKIHDLLTYHINENQKKLFFFCSLACFNITGFKELKKIYPRISEKISYEDIQNSNVLDYVERRITQSRYSSDFIEIVKCYKIEDISINADVIRKNVWQILQYENIPAIKAELKKHIIKKSQSLDLQKRI